MSDRSFNQDKQTMNGFKGKFKVKAGRVGRDDEMLRNLNSEEEEKDFG